MSWQDGRAADTLEQLIEQNKEQQAAWRALRESLQGMDPDARLNANADALEPFDEVAQRVEWQTEASALMHHLGWVKG